jgi:GNAT superfamily N-acetyltransferase
MLREGTGSVLISDGVGGGGSTADVERAVLRDGSRVVIRPLTAGDEAAIASWFSSWFAGLGAETLYARLFVLLGRLNPRADPALAHVGRFGHEAITAFAPDGVTVGIARYLRGGEPASAEVTVAVAEAWRGRGIASMLLERVAARARSVGIEELTTICLAGNHTLIRLLSRLGATTVSPSNAGLVDVRIDLRSGPPDRCARRPASGGRSD